MATKRKRYRIITLIILGIVGVLSIQIMTLFFLSENKKSEVVIGDLTLLLHVNQFDSLAFTSNFETENKLITNSLRNRFKDSIKYIKILEFKEWTKFRTDPNYMAIGAFDSSEYKMLFNSNTNIGTLQYGESWSNSYIWVFYKWIKIKQKNTGVS